MSYFGNQGPAQDGGFISGIARGNARLHNARVTRARYQKGIGAVRDYIPMANDFPDDAILYKRAKKFTEGYQGGQEMKQALDRGDVTPRMADPILKQYENDRRLIAQWAESGPYVKESKAFMIGTAPILLAIGTYAAYSYLAKRPFATAKGAKSAFYGVFS